MIVENYGQRGAIQLIAHDGNRQVSVIVECSSRKVPVKDADGKIDRVLAGPQAIADVFTYDVMRQIERGAPLRILEDPKTIPPTSAAKRVRVPIDGTDAKSAKSGDKVDRRG